MHGHLIKMAQQCTFPVATCHPTTIYFSIFYTIMFLPNVSFLQQPASHRSPHISHIYQPYLYIPCISYIYPRHPPKIYFKKHLSCSSLPPTIPPGLTSPFSTSHSEIECKLFKCLMLKIQIQTSMGMWRYLGIRLCPIVIIPPSYSV